MINLDNIINENNEEHNEKWPYILDHPYSILIIGGSGSGKTNNIIDNIINENNEEQNEKWPYILDHPYSILIIGGSGSGKTNTLLSLINEQKDLTKFICMEKI